MYAKKIRLTFLVFFFYQIMVFGQEDFSLKLLNAENLYKEGKLEQIESILLEEIKGNISQNQKIRGYELLSHAYLYTYQRAKGIQSIHKLLHLNPFYRVDKSKVSNEFVTLVNCFTRRPFIFYGVDFGGGLNEVNLIKEYSISNNFNSRSFYEKGSIFSAYINLGIHISHWLSFKSALGVKSQNIIYNDENIINILDTKTHEHQLFLSYLLSSDIDFRKKKNLYYSSEKTMNSKSKVFPFIRFGCLVNELKNSEMSLNATFRLEGVNEYSSDKISYLEQRYPYEIQIFGGVGLKKQIKKNVFCLWVQYQYALNDLSIESDTYKESEVLNNYAYVDNEVRFNQVTLNVGVQHNFYRIKFKNKKNGSFR